MCNGFNNGFCGRNGCNGYGGCAHGPYYCNGPYMHHHHHRARFGCLGSIVRFFIGLAVIRFFLRLLFF